MSVIFVGDPLHHPPLLRAELDAIRGRATDPDAVRLLTEVDRLRALVGLTRAGLGAALEFVAKTDIDLGVLYGLREIHREADKLVEPRPEMS